MAEQSTILVVDDNQELREGLTAMLGQHGYRTMQADNGWEARQLIDEHSPDLVILDMMMPQWGGLAVLEHFQGRSGAPRFIMITANEGARHQDYAERLGVFDYIRKPFSLKRVLEGVAKLFPAPVPAQQPTPARKMHSASMHCRCPGCGSRIKAPMQFLGRTRTCPGCRLPFVLQLQPPEDQGSALVMDAG